MSVLSYGLRSTLVILATGIAVGLTGCAHTNAAGGASVAANGYGDHIDILADDAFGGRGVGSPGIEMAAAYIAGQFAEIGIEPGGDDGTYFQNFTLQLKSKIGAGTRLAIGTEGRRVRRPVRLHDDFVPLPFSASGTFKGEVVFAGYGIVNDDEELGRVHEMRILGMGPPPAVMYAS